MRIAQPLEVQFGRVMHLNDGHEDQHVHDVMRVEEEIEFAGKVALGHAESSDDTSQYCYGVLLGEKQT